MYYNLWGTLRVANFFNAYKYGYYPYSNRNRKYRDKKTDKHELKRVLEKYVKKIG